MRTGLIIVLMCVLAMVLPAACFSQDDGMPAENDVEYSYGTVVTVNKDSGEMTISEYDWSNDTEAEVTFAVDPKVELENVTDWKEIAAGSEVDIEYVMANGKKTARYISVYTMTDDNAYEDMNAMSESE